MCICQKWHSKNNVWLYVVFFYIKITCIVQLFVNDNFKSFVAWVCKIAASATKMCMRLLSKYSVWKCMSLNLQEKQPVARRMSQFEVPKHCITNTSFEPHCNYLIVIFKLIFWIILIIYDVNKYCSSVTKLECIACSIQKIENLISLAVRGPLSISLLQLPFPLHHHPTFSLREQLTGWPCWVKLSKSRK